MIENITVDDQKRASTPAIRFKEMTPEMFENLEAGKFGTGEFLMIDILKSPKPFVINVSEKPNQYGYHYVNRCYSGKTSWQCWGLRSCGARMRSLREDLDTRIKKYGRTYYGIAFVDYENIFL